MKKMILAFAIALLLIAGCAKKEDQDTLKARKIIDYHMKEFDSFPLSGSVIDGTRVIELKGSQYTWEPENIVVNKGDKVRLIVESLDVPHGFEIEGIMIPNWNPDNLIRKGDKAVLEFTADSAGMWDTVCTGYCGAGHATMKRKFIVRG